MIPLRDSVRTARTPVVVYGLIAVNSLVFLYQISLTPNEATQFAYQYALVPRRYFQPAWGLYYGLSPGNYLPFLTSMFMHGGWLHVILNMWVLYIFGSSLEGRMGRVAFVIFYLACGLAAGVAHAWFNQASTVPVLGASGAIAGVIGAYAASFPRARITVLVPIVIIPLIFEVPAILFAAFWFFLQVLQGAWEALAPTMGGGIAWWAHVGGFIAGLLLIPFFYRRRNTQTEWDRGPWG